MKINTTNQNTTEKFTTESDTTDPDKDETTEKADDQSMGNDVEDILGGFEDEEE